MQTYLLPVQVILNPPDVIIQDLLGKFPDLLCADYRVFYVNFEARAIRFTGLYSQEGSENKLKPDYLFWNRSFYTAEMFYIEKPTEEIFHLLSELKKSDLIIPKLLKIVYLDVLRFKDLFDISQDATLSSENYLIYKQILAPSPPTLNEYIYLKPIESGYILNVLELKIKQIFAIELKSKITILPLKVINIASTVFGTYKFSIFNAFVDVGGIETKIGNFIVPITISNTLYKFVTITEVNKFYFISENLFQTKLIFKLRR